MQPKVTVLMPVYNGEKYLREAMDSILNQTFTDFEFLIMNDGSTDRSVEIIEAYYDKRIKLVHNEKNLGLIATLNKGLDLAKGEYIARMDCDDISLPERLEKQVVFMEGNERVGLCGSWIQFLGGRNGAVFKYPFSNNELKVKIMFGDYFAHPAVILRKKYLDKYNLRYDFNYIHAEDYALWVKCSRFFDMSNLKEPLLKYRIGHASISKIYANEQRSTTQKIYKENFRRLGIHDEVKLDILVGNTRATRKLLSEISMELHQIIQKNVLYSSAYLRESIAECWNKVCYRSTKFVGVYAVYLYHQHLFTRKVKLKNVDYVKFLIKAIFYL